MKLRPARTTTKTTMSTPQTTSKAAEAAKMTGGQKQALYRRLLELKDSKKEGDVPGKDGDG